MNPRDGWRIGCGWSIGGKDRTYQKELHAQGSTGFDEIIVGKWLHLERMHMGRWFLVLGDKEADIIVNQKGVAEIKWRDWK